MFRDELFSGLKKGGGAGSVLSLQIVNELKHRCLFFGRQRIHCINEIPDRHPEGSITRPGGSAFASTMARA